MAEDKTKTLGQVWTPPSIVKIILDKVEFLGEKTLTSKILEPSFGEGVFLEEILARMVNEGWKQNKTNYEISQLIDENLFAVEYDAEIFKQTKINLIKLAKEAYNLVIFLPNVIQADSLTFKKPNFFDFVVGNPPYVRIHNLPEDMRKKVKEYSTATGTTDLYIIFYELGLAWLNKEGKLGYIAPNSWLKNASQKKMRENLLKNKHIKEIIDYGQVKIFQGVSAYTNISILDKKGNDTFVYTEMLTEEKIDFTIIKKCDEVDPSKPFVFLSEQNSSFIEKYQTPNNNNKIPISSIGKVQNGLATLADKVFLVDKIRFETSELVLPAVKASTFKGDLKQSSIMFFPYQNTSGKKYEGISEEKFSEIDQGMYEYFLEKKTLLEKRSTDKGSIWFWYGRSQAIQETGKQKLIISPLVHPNFPIKTFIVPENTLVYSGLFITALDGRRETLEKIKSHLETPEFLKFSYLLGKNMSGGYKSITAPILKSFILK